MFLHVTYANLFLKRESLNEVDSCDKTAVIRQDGQMIRYGITDGQVLLKICRHQVQLIDD